MSDELIDGRYKHTGNAHQGHYWSYCSLTKTSREFHLCCPGNCELGPEDPEEST